MSELQPIDTSNYSDTELAPSFVVTPEDLHAKEWTAYRSVFDQVLLDFSAVGERFNAPHTSEDFTDEYQQNVAEPAQRLNRGITTLFDLRSPPDKYPGYLDLEGVLDVLESQQDNDEPPQMAYQLINQACHHLNFTPSEYRTLVDYAHTMIKSETIENHVKELQKAAARVRAEGIELIQEHKRQHHS